MTDKSAGKALLPCPAGHDEAKVTRDVYFHVECMHDDCDWKVRGLLTEALAIARWNLRASPQPSEPAAPTGDAIASAVYGAVFAALIDGGAHVTQAREAAEKFSDRARSNPAAPVAAGSEKCPDCNGEGERFAAGRNAHPSNLYTCETCKGSGRARTAHPEPAAAEPVAWKFKVGDRVRHKHGGEYVIEEGPQTCRIEADNMPAYAYRSSTLTLWVRPWANMEDESRFTLIASAPSQPSEGPARVTDVQYRTALRNIYPLFGDIHEDTVEAICRAFRAALAAAEGKAAS
jgi:hypothetical protein